MNMCPSAKHSLVASNITINVTSGGPAGQRPAGLELFNQSSHNKPLFYVSSNIAKMFTMSLRPAGQSAHSHDEGPYTSWVLPRIGSLRAWVLIYRDDSLRY